MTTIWTCDCGRACPMDEQTHALVKAGQVTVCTCKNQGPAK